MIIGMLPMALGLGEGGEQNAPLGRAVIGGLLLATVTTLVCGSDCLQPAAQEAAGRFRTQNRGGGARISARRDAAA